MTGAELMALIEAGQPPVILDVRTPEEFAAGRIPGAINVPFQEVGRRLVEQRLTPDARRPPLQPIVIYCGHGPRAWLAGAALRRRGFTLFEYLKGHMAGWRRAGLLEER